MIRNKVLLNFTMKRNLIILVASVAIVSIAMSSCKNTINTPIGDIVFPASNVSYSQQVQPLFNLGCDYLGCHDDETMAGNLSLTNYISATTAPGVIRPRDTTSSILIQRIEGKGPIMPPAASPLNQNQIKGLKTWIMEGAKNN